MKFNPNTYQPTFNPFSIISFIVLTFLSPTPTYTQTIFQEKATEVGINHYFHNGNMMGGGVAVFDFNLDGWEDIWINGCLLYTSPSPRDATLSRMPSSA